MKLLQFIGANRIATQVWSLLAVVYLASAVFITVILFDGFRSDILESAESDIKHRLELARQEQLQYLTEVERHAAILARAPQVLNFSSEEAGSITANGPWRTQTEQLFAAVMETYPEYFQIRLLDAGTGEELVRTNKVGNEISTVELDELQPKGNRPYFQEALKLQPGQFYFSRFDLNQEHGQLSYPYIKTIRVATPIADSTGALRSVLVINVDASKWFDHIATYRQERDSIYLIDANGDFLHHANDQQTFASLKSLPPGAADGLDAALLQLPVSASTAFESINNRSTEYLVWQLPYSYGEHVPNEVRLVAAVKKELLFESGRNKIRTTFYGSIAALAGGLLLLLWLSRSVVQPIHRLDKQLSAFVPGGPIPTFEIARSDELGGLARTFFRLAGRVNEQIEQLNEARTKAETSVAEKEAFLGNFSHELRTPLNSIAGMTEVLRYKPHSEEQRPVIETLKYSVENLSALISDVLDYNRILEGNLQLSVSEVLPEEVARNLCLALDLKARGGNINLSYAVADNVPHAIITDKVRLTQIINNLLYNALKFTEAGAVSLTLGWEASTLIIRVKDTGIGMKDTEVREIFQRYHQAEGGLKSRSGLGLGLAIVKHLVALFGGNIEVASEYGKGSEFIVRIPAKGVKLDSTQPAQRTLLSSHISVLYVDDVAVNRITVEHFLLPAGIKLVCVASCAEALAVLENQQFDAVLMDLRMPEMDGFECIECVRKMVSDLPIIAVSANLGDEELNRLTAMGIRHAIEKPINPQQLFARLLEVTQAPTTAVFGQLMANFCNNDAALLRRLVEQFRVLLASCKQELSAHQPLPGHEEATKTLVRDLRHKLHPTVVMFDQLDKAFEIGASHDDPKTAMLATIAHLEKYLDQFEQEQLQG